MIDNRAKFDGVVSKVRSKFPDLFNATVFTLSGGFDPLTRLTSTTVTETVGAAREDYEANQIDGQMIKSNDFKLIAQKSDFKLINPKKSGLKAYVDGVDCTVVSAKLDPADAAWTIQVRG